MGNLSFELHVVWIECSNEGKISTTKIMMNTISPKHRLSTHQALSEPQV